MNPPVINSVTFSGDRWFTEITLEGTEYFGSGEVWYQVESGTGRLLDVEDLQIYSDLMAIHNKAVHMNVRAAMRQQRVAESPLNIHNSSIKK